MNWREINNKTGRKMEYKIVKKHYYDTYSLENDVNILLKSGWVPVGGVSFSQKREAVYQALIRKVGYTND